jgi:hypothetical protein
MNTKQEEQQQERHLLSYSSCHTKLVDKNQDRIRSLMLNRKIDRRYDENIRNLRLHPMLKELAK